MASDTNALLTSLECNPYCGMMGKNNVPVRYSRGLGQGRTGQEDAREAGKTSGGPV